MSFSRCAISLCSSVHTMDLLRNCRCGEKKFVLQYLRARSPATHPADWKWGSQSVGHCARNLRMSARAKPHCSHPLKIERSMYINILTVLKMKQNGH